MIVVSYRVGRVRSTTGAFVRRVVNRPGPFISLPTRFSGTSITCGRFARVVTSITPSSTTRGLRSSNGLELEPRTSATRQRPTWQTRSISPTAA